MGFSIISSKLFQRRRPGALILMYHRIREEGSDPWEICVREDHFRLHMEVLGRFCRVHPLSRLKEVLSDRKQDGKNVFITFDDGYLDTLECAVPLLEKFGFPATFFIPSRNLTDAGPFWWETVDGIFWSRDALPGEFNLSCGREHFKKTLPAEACRRDRLLENNWSANTASPPTDRCRLYLELCAWIKTLSPDEQQMITGQLIAQAGGSSGFEEDFKKISPPWISTLAKGSFEIGAHTVHHPALGYQSDQIQRQEISLGKLELEALTGKPVTQLAYPHGHYTDQTKAIARDCGFQLACTTAEGLIGNGTDRLALPRIWMKNISAEAFVRQLENLFR
jgi:peptidoglycan/xylan/chitin deacetylase (PgdA/CDA1 family)